MPKREHLHYLAFDLGAESGRAMLAGFDGQRLVLREARRFATGPVRVGDHLYWDALRFWSEIQAGLADASLQVGDSLASLGLDTWGVDFGLLDEADNLIGNPYHYRDSRTNGMLEKAFERVPREQLYEFTGIQFMQLNSLYQLLAMQSENSSALRTAQTFLNMPDLFNFWLSGRKASEFTIATTTQCFDARKQQWAYLLLAKLKLPVHIFQPIIKPATVLEMLRASVAAETGSARIPVVAVGGHDTASAVAAVPAETDDFVYLSSGTWSLIGVELSQPLITPEALACDFTNEGGLNDTIRFLKSIMGMWLLQECRREWAKTGQVFSYDELTALARVAPAFKALISPGDAFFLAPGEMPARIQTYCKKTGQSVPQTPGEIVRCILESLALEYRNVITNLRELLGRPLSVLHIIGGGSRNHLLNQFTADATGCHVLAGPVESTAIGNALAQALALGHIASLSEGRSIVRRSFDVLTFEPGSSGAWDAAYQRYLNLNLEVR